jgi:DNA polymerase III subunit beta
MQFIVDQRTLLKELNFLQGVVEKKALIPVLGHLLIETEGNRLRLQATDLDLSLTTACEAAVDGKGSLCVPAKKLHEIVKSLPSAKVIFKLEEKHALHLTCERARFKLNGIEREQFPEVPTAPALNAQLPAARLRQIITRTLFAVTDQDSRYSINGVKLELTGHRLRMVATDGHRLSLVEVNGDFGKDLAIDTIIPKKAIGELARLAVEADGEIGFAVTDNHVFFQAGQRRMVTRRLAQDFPNYELVIPKENTRHLELATSETAAALRRVALMADDRTRGISLGIKAGQLTLSSQASNAGEAGEVIEAGYDGDEINAACNVSYLQDFLNVAGSERVRLELKDANTQFCLRPVEPSGINFTYVLMPIRM